MPSYAAIAPIAQHRGGDAQLASNLDQRPTAARQQGDRLRLELIRKMTPFLAHSTPSRSSRSLAKVSTNSGEAHLDIAQPGRRHTLLLSLLRQARMRGRDELIEMMLRRIRRTQAAAKEQLETFHDRHREIEETLIGIFGQVIETAQVQETDAE